MPRARQALPQHNDVADGGGDGGGRRAADGAVAAHDGAAAERLLGRVLNRARELPRTPPTPRRLLLLHVLRPRCLRAQQPLQLAHS